MDFTKLQTLTIVLFFIILVVWLFAITNKAEHVWAKNPWLPTTVVALVWSVWADSTYRSAIKKLKT
jgi:hypothetical protein